MIQGNNRKHKTRHGNIATLTALLLVPILAIVALAIDLGVVHVNRAELRSAADAGSMAAAWELLEAKFPGTQLDSDQIVSRARNSAKQYAASNCRGQRLSELDDQDVEIGYLADPSSDTELDKSDPEKFNAVRLRVRRDNTANGPIQLIFARLIGTESVEISSTATAALVANIRGFQIPDDPTKKLPIIPFAFDLESWESIEAGIGNDHWRWDDDANKFVPGSDGITEFNFFPLDTGSAGNRGTVNIGSNDNSTQRVSRQILEGISADDLSFHSDQLVLDSHGTLQLGADPGISSGFKDELQAIIGQPRILPIFSKLSGNGNNGSYTIVRWIGIRIIEVNLTGSSKFVIAQAAPIVVEGTIPSSDGNANSQYVFSPVWIVE